MSFPKYSAYKDSGIEWLGSVPSEWCIAPIKAIASCNDEVLPETTDGDTVIEYVEISGVEEGRGITETATLSFSAAPSRARRVIRHGDVLISTVRTYLRAIATVAHPPDNLIASTGFAAIRPRQVEPRFLGYLLHCEYLMSEVIARSVGVSYPAINASELMRLKGPLPSVKEQRAIATFLDRETAKIDALVEEQKRLIELLKEKRQAVISQAVTKALDPNVPMKDSGVEWLGKVPAHWTVKALKHAIARGTSISYGIVQPGESLEVGVPFIQTTNMTNGEFDLEVLQRTSREIASAYPRSCLTGGEVLLGIRASIGACHVVPKHLAGCNLSRGVARIVCDDDLQSDFLVCYLSTDEVARYWQLAKQGSTFNEVSIETVRELLVLVPPLAEQQEISQSVKALRAQLEALVAEAEAAMELLRERRTALISAAVTGKIDVRGLVPQPEVATA